MHSKIIATRAGAAGSCKNDSNESQRIVKRTSNISSNEISADELLGAQKHFLFSTLFFSSCLFFSTTSFYFYQLIVRKSCRSEQDAYHYLGDAYVYFSAKFILALLFYYIGKCKTFLCKNKRQKKRTNEISIQICDHMRYFKTICMI